MSMPSLDRTASEDRAAAVSRALIDRFGTVTVDGTRSYGAADVLAIDSEGLLGLLVDEAADRVQLDAAGAAALDTLAASAAREAVILESRAAATVDSLAAVGIETRVLKGLAVAHLDHEVPGHRSFCDIDLLVRGHDIHRATEVLHSAGFRRHFAEPFVGFDGRVGKGVAVGDELGIVIDLHRTLALGYYGTRFPVELLWDGADEFELAGSSVHALPRPMRFLHCALHLALSPRTAVRDGFDLVVMGSREPALDAAEVIALADDAGCGHPVSQAVARTAEWLGDAWAPRGLIDWARDRRPRAFERWMMASYHGRWASSRSRSVTALAGLRGADRRFAAKGLLSGSLRRSEEER